MLKKIFTKIFLHFVDVSKVAHKIEEIKIKTLYSNCVMGLESCFYKTTSIENRMKDKNRIVIGEHCHIKGSLMIMGYGGQISIGNYSFVGEHSNIWSGDNIKIGNHVLISHNVNIIDTNSHELNHLQRAEDFKLLITQGYSKTKGTINCESIIIDDYAWINFNAVIQKGVKIGKGAIIAPNSVVVGDVAPFTLVAGNPARFIKKVE